MLAFTHTHTHILFWTFIREFAISGIYMQPWTCTEFSRMNMDFLCMCVKFNHLIMDYPLPLPICMPRCELQPNGGSLAIVDVHDWCVSTVLRDFSDGVSMVECAYKRTLMHTHSIHIHSHKQSIMYKHTCKQTKCVCMRVCVWGGGGGGHRKHEMTCVHSEPLIVQSVVKAHYVCVYMCVYVFAGTHVYGCVCVCIYLLPWTQIRKMTT